MTDAEVADQIDRADCFIEQLRDDCEQGRPITYVGAPTWRLSGQGGQR